MTGWDSACDSTANASARSATLLKKQMLPPQQVRPQCMLLLMLPQLQLLLPLLLQRLPLLLLGHTIIREIKHYEQPDPQNPRGRWLPPLPPQRD